MKTEEKIIFLHIPKTAGTSLRQLIEQVYPGEQCLYLYYPSPYQPEVIDHIQKHLPLAKALYGHVSFGIHQLLGIQGKYVTFLRDPIKRVISFYHHNAREPNMPYYQQIQQGMSLLEMLHCELTPETNNHMVRIIACHSSSRLLDEDIVLEQALNHLNQFFCFVGLVEQLTKSIHLLAQKLDWKQPLNIPHLVKAPLQQYEYQLDSQTQAALEKYNRLDILLYQSIKQKIFDPIPS